MFPPFLQSQYVEHLPQQSSVWWDQPTPRVLPNNIQTFQGGISRIAVAVQANQEGSSRVQNSISGYNVWVGAGSLPDLTQPPTTFSAILPISIPLTPPGAGTETFYILVLTQDEYGLNSRNQTYTTVTIDSSGNLVRPTVPTPQNLGMVQGRGGSLRVLAAYPTVTTDEYPADQWKIWTKSGSPPNPSIDTPVSIVPVGGKILAASIGSPGTNTYLAVGLYRSVDGVLSQTLTGSIVIQSPPSEVVAVPSGFQGA